MTKFWEPKEGWKHSEIKPLLSEEAQRILDSGDVSILVNTESNGSWGYSRRVVSSITVRCWELDYTTFNRFVRIKDGKIDLSKLEGKILFVNEHAKGIAKERARRKELRDMVKSQITQNKNVLSFEGYLTDGRVKIDSDTGEVIITIKYDSAEDAVAFLSQIDSDEEKVIDSQPYYG